MRLRTNLLKEIAREVLGRIRVRPELDWASAKVPVDDEFPADDPSNTIYSFNIQGIQLEVPRSLLQPDIWRSLVYGSYEGSEIDALRYAIRPGDAVLEIGAGIGFISSFAKRELQASRIVAIEADPVLIPVIKHTHAVNGISAEVRNVVAAVTDGVVEFNRQPSFWASSIVDLPGSTKVRLPARSLQGLIEDVDPDVLVVDTEGAEGRLFEGLRLPRTLRHAVVEVHKQQIGSLQFPHASMRCRRLPWVTIQMGHPTRMSHSAESTDKAGAPTARPNLAPFWHT